MHALTIVCPVDYSDCSKRALRYAGALTDHFGARLVVLHVFDPLLASAAHLHQFELLGEDGQRELADFVEEHLSREVRGSNRLEQVLTVGAAGSQIVELATRRAADLVVMSKQEKGRRGAGPDLLPQTSFSLSPLLFPGARSPRFAVRP